MVDFTVHSYKVITMYIDDTIEYVDSLVGFHKDAMEFFRSLDVYGTSDRLVQAERLVALIRQGEAIEEQG